MFKNILSFALIAVLLLGCMPEKESNTSSDPKKVGFGYKFVLVRHAEKEAGNDPGLTPEGSDRALRLAELLQQEEVTAIYSTDYRRTKATVDPLAIKSSLLTQVYTPMEEAFLPSLFEQYPKGGLFVIAGHSNTIPGLVNQLIGEKKYLQLDEKDYNDLFIVTTSAVGNGTVIQLTY